MSNSRRRPYRGPEGKTLPSSLTLPSSPLLSAADMRREFLRALVALLALLATAGAEPAQLLPKAPVLPLDLDDNIQFRKTIIFVNDPKQWKSTQEDMITLERLRVNYGAVTQYDRQQRYGHYYQFFWRNLRPAAELTIRFEYRQEKLGAYVQAQQRTYKDLKKGSIESKFAVIGDDYNQDGRVTAWRAIVIENGRIVALNQSFLWR